MYCSIRDNLLLENFDTPAAGLCHLGVDAVEIELVRDFQVLAMDTREMVPLATDADAKKYAQHLDSLDIRPVSFLTACDFTRGHGGRECAVDGACHGIGGNPGDG